MAPTMPSQSEGSAAFSYCSDFARLPFNSTSPSFRLLTLHGSANTQDPLLHSVSADIFVTPIATSPKFQALSYTWGTGERTHRISLSGAVLRVTASLDSALRHLRPASGQSIVLWIDQICINQDDEKEKTAQVKLMHQIYTGAEQVIVWLGPAADESDKLMCFLSRIGDEAAIIGLDSENLEAMRWLRTQDNELTRSVEVQFVLGFIDHLSSDLESVLPALLAWCQRPWFSRVWVFQESALNSETVFRCGGETIGAETLMGAMALLAPRLSQVVSGMQLVADKTGPRLLRDLFNPSSSRKLCLSPPQFRIRCRYQSISRKPAGPGLSTFDLLKELYVVSGTKATNKQDRIFGLLALADDAERLGISADYSGTGLVALFSHVAAAIIMDSGCLDILSFAYNPKDVPGLPSWVPDWRPCLKGPYSCKGGPSLFSASGRMKATTLRTSRQVLTLEAIRVDVVGEVCSSGAGRDDGQYENPLSRLVEINRLVTLSGEKNRPIYTNPGPREEAYWRIPIGDLEHLDGTVEFTRRASSDAKRWYWELIEYLRRKAPDHVFETIAPPTWNDPSRADDKVKPLAGQETSNYMLCMAKMQDMKPFLTKEGYIGMGPSTLSPGDVIMVLIGANVPFALRPVEGETNRFSLVGEAYCDGIMDGEMMQGNTPTEISLV
jgi:hypothetical protein